MENSPVATVSSLDASIYIKIKVQNALGRLEIWPEYPGFISQKFVKNVLGLLNFIWCTYLLKIFKNAEKKTQKYRF